MADAIKVGIIGCGWPGTQHALGYKQSGGFRIVAIADLIPQRRRQVIETYAPNAKEYDDGAALIKDRNIDAVSICVPNDLHAPMTLAALRIGKHVICEKPPTISAAE